MVRDGSNRRPPAFQEATSPLVQAPSRAAHAIRVGHQRLTTIDLDSLAASPWAARSDSAAAISASRPSTACKPGHPGSMAEPSSSATRVLLARDRRAYEEYGGRPELLVGPGGGDGRGLCQPRAAPQRRSNHRLDAIPQPAGCSRMSSCLASLGYVCQIAEAASQAVSVTRAGRLRRRRRGTARVCAPSRPGG